MREVVQLELVSKELNNLAAILHVYAGGQSYIHQVLQTIQMKLIISCVWAEPAVLGSTKTGKTHDLNHDLTLSAHTINCVCHIIRSMFRVLGMYNFGHILKR